MVAVSQIEVKSTVEKPEVKKMNAADRFKPVSQIEVRRTVGDVDDIAGRVNVGERYRPSSGAGDVSPRSVEQPESVGRLNAERFKPVSQIEVRRTVVCYCCSFMVTVLYGCACPC